MGADYLIMNFTLLFSLISSNSFILHWNISDTIQQDFFIFNGDDCYAHLFRQNDTLLLRMKFNEYTYETLEYSGFNQTFAFSWPECYVDGVNMEGIRTEDTFETVDMTFSEVIFISPIVDFADGCGITSLIEPSYFSFTNINYWYILIINVAVLITLYAGFKSKPVASEIYSRGQDLWNNLPENDCDSGTKL